MRITGATRLSGLFGYPVKHTISPLLHNAAFKRFGINCFYLPFSIHPEDLKDAVKNLAVYGFIGINVTVPHKQTIMKYLDRITPEAKMIGAVNTVLVKKGKLIGFNTDGIGFMKSLRWDNSYNLKGKVMFLLGAGGAGHAVAVAAALNGIKKIFIVDAVKSRARKLKKRIPDVEVEIADLNEMNREAVMLSDLIVNATPIGLSPKDPISIPANWLPKKKVVYDLIYNPKETKLLKAARGKGCKTINGLGMLLNQAAASFEIWTGKHVPIKLMAKAVNPVRESH